MAVPAGWRVCRQEHRGWGRARRHHVLLALHEGRGIQEGFLGRRHWHGASVMGRRLRWGLNEGEASRARTEHLGTERPALGSQAPGNAGTP